MVTKLVAEGAQECTERGDLLTHCCPRPYPDQPGFRVVVAEQLGRRVLANSQRSSGKNSNAALMHFIEFRCGIQKVRTDTTNIRSRFTFHCPLQGFRDR